MAAGAFRFEIAADARRMQAIAGAWDALAEATGEPNIFYESWMALPALALPEAAGMRCALLWQADTLIGVLPLQPVKGARGRASGALQNWDQRLIGLGEPLIRAGHERSFWTAVLAHVDETGRIGGYLRLSRLIATSVSTVMLLALLDERGRPAHVTRQLSRALLVGEGQSSADYQRLHIRKKVLKEQKRLRNRLGELGALTVEHCAGDTAHAWIEDFIALETQGWKGRRGVAAGSEAVLETLWRTVLRDAAARGRIDMHRLALDGRAISLLINISAGARQAFSLKVTYDEAYARFSPGVLLQMDYLTHALDVTGMAWVDSCAREGHPMIDRIWAGRRPILSLKIPYDDPLARLLAATEQRALPIVARLRQRRANQAEATEAA